MTTKFDINQEVFFMNEYGIQKGFVYKIHIEDGGKVLYETNGGTEKRYEKYLFATREELIDFLTEQKVSY